MLRCSPGGNNANALLAFGVGYIQHNVTFSHADENKTLLRSIANGSLKTVFAKSKLTP
jgi:hypothetical protein